MVKFEVILDYEDTDAQTFEIYTHAQGFSSVLDSIRETLRSDLKWNDKMSEETQKYIEHLQDQIGEWMSNEHLPSY